MPATRRRGTAKPRRAGHPAALPDNQVAGQVGPARRMPGATSVAAVPLYQTGQQLMLLGGGNRWARAHALCRVIALLPHDSGPFLYRVRSEVESYERIVAEADLSLAD